MKIIFSLLLSLFMGVTSFATERFPDGKPISKWFSDKKIADINTLGKRYNILEYGVCNDSTIVQTRQIQHVIDKAAATGGVIIIPKGTFLTGALFFKANTHLHIEKDGVLKGSDDISDFPVIDTRIEGQNIKYFPAIVNVDDADGFTITGNGTINGNGLRYWKSFWLRRAFNPQCTNLDEMRPRILIVTNCRNVQISGIRLINSPYWTTHFYRCENVKLLNLHIFAPAHPVGAPSSDAIDLDVCKNVLISGCYMSVNDDAVCLKGGKGPWADKDKNNGSNHDIIVEDCIFGFCHSALTCGSESIHNRNVIVRNCTIDKADRVLHLKMRPDTPQRYEYILMENISGNAKHFLFVKPWTQFFNLKDRKDIPYSYADKITIRNVQFKCNNYIYADTSEQYFLSDFKFENHEIQCKESGITPEVSNFIRWSNVTVNGQKIENNTKLNEP